MTIRTPPGPPAAPLPFVANEPPHEAAAIVVGTGFGGAVTACRLAQAGIDVLVLERGRRYEADDFPPLPADATLFPDIRRWTWQQSQGLWDILDLEEVISVQAAGLGGGSLIYANVHLRPPPEVFNERWPAVYQRGDELQDYFDLAAYMLDVAPIDAHPDLAGKLPKTQQLDAALAQLQRNPTRFHPPLAISRRRGLNVHNQQQNACDGCGACCTGCPKRAKNTLDFNYLAIAERRGARVVTQCEVTRVRQLENGGWELDCVDHLNARRTRYTAPAVFLCAGSVHSTRLMATSRLLSQSSGVKRVVGVGYFPGGDAIGVVYDTANPQHPSYGPAITTCNVQWDDDRSFFLIQDGGYAQQLERLVGTLRAPLWTGRNRLTRTGSSLVEPSELQPPPRLVQPAPLPLALASPLDDLLAARRLGAFTAVVSPEVRAQIDAFLLEAERPLLLAPIVDRVVDQSLRAWVSRFWISPKGCLGRLLLWFGKKVVRFFFGKSPVIGDRALHALLGGAGLPAPEWLGQIFGYAAPRPDHRLMLLAMGRDAAQGSLVYDGARDRMVADLDLYHLAPGYSAEERLMSDIARSLGGELRTNPAWASLGKPITVHNQGGCPMSDDPFQGVTDPDGAVHGCEGLYILDGSILCTSVGVNPSATITALAERNVLTFIQSHLPGWPQSFPASPGAREYADQRAAAARWRQGAANWALSPPRQNGPDIVSRPVGVRFNEVMHGYYLDQPAPPANDAEYRRYEIAGRPRLSLEVSLDIGVENLARFFEDMTHRLEVRGHVTLRLPGQPDGSPPERFEIDEGCLELFVERYKPYAISRHNRRRRRAQERLAGPYRAQRGSPPKHQRRYMHYQLGFMAGGRRWVIDGHKTVRDDPGPDAWRDTSSLFFDLFEGHERRGAGVIHASLEGFGFHQVPSLTVTGVPRDASGQSEDPARELWAKVTFAAFFFGTLQRIYAPALTDSIQSLFGVNPSNLRREPRGVL